MTPVPAGAPTRPVAPDATVIAHNVRQALEEDVGSGDVTAALVPESSRARARVVCRESAVLCGRDWFDQVYAQLDVRVCVSWQSRDGDLLEPQQCAGILEGPARAVLTGERTALNFIQLLSGTATAARLCAQAVEGTRTRILDTRKTLPGLRLAQKYAVRCGGCDNHRLGLYDAILIKDNHIVTAGSVAAAVSAARRLNPDLTLEVEVENLEQLGQAIEAGADVIMLDNFPGEALRDAVSITAGRAKLEISGNIPPNEIRALAETGVDYISLGALTKNLRAIDFSMDFEPLTSA
ncbi:MAG TPA: carboxylating nicotinate-nucleotide diphosphorylase [Gammaproteobacteria bacterium]|nr:carboxylating nicotinate-nucleotide diphosphorylase [Gammaproteobacteria bacterium]